MADLTVLDLNTWITFIELPLFSTLFWLYWRQAKDHHKDLQKLRETMETQLKDVYLVFNRFQLDVANRYAKSSDLKEISVSLTSHLLRIEAKLDNTALKTEALKAFQGGQV